MKSVNVILKFSCAVTFVMVIASVMRDAHAEPYLAVRAGGECMMCHTNPTGGGKRNVFGNVYAQRTLAARYVENAGNWDGSLNRFLSLGADYRGEFRFNDTPGQSSMTEFSYEETLLYLELQPVPGRVSLYVDEKLGPGSATTREAYGLLWLQPGESYVKAGRFFLPYGLRVEDDGAFIRSVTGISYDTPDDGVELGLEHGFWSAQLALTNGSGGGNEQDNDKRVSINAVYTQPRWRIGASANNNETTSGERDMYGIYAGVRTGPVSWLLELDQIRDTLVNSSETDQTVSLVEANWLLRQGSNLKFTYEWHEFDSAVPGPSVDDNRERMSLVWEYFPLQYMQLSMGYRDQQAPLIDQAGNRDTAFVQLHLFF